MLAKTRTALTAGVTVVLVALSSAAYAADFSLSSSTGRSSAWYNDGADTISVCDMRNGDGVGAIMWFNDYDGITSGQRTVYNGCANHPGIADGHRISFTVCDWVHSAAHGHRVADNCRYRHLDRS